MDLSRPVFVLNQTLCAAINHLLEGEEWARAKLRAHQGKIALIKVAQLDFSFQVLPSGLIDAAAQDAETQPALTIALPPGSLLAALRGRAGEAGTLKNVDVHGDADFAQVVLFLVGNLRWDAEEDLARLIGDIAAHRMAADLRSLIAWESDTRTRLAQSAGEYLTTEAEILAAASPIDNFAGATDRLRDDTARLEQRIERLGSGRAKKKAG